MRAVGGAVVVIVATFAVLVAAGLLFAVRLAIGPSLADRLNAVNGLLVVGTIAVAAQAMQTRRGAFLTVVVVLSLVGFVGTAMVARYIEESDR